MMIDLQLYREVSLTACGPTTALPGSPNTIPAAPDPSPRVRVPEIIIQPSKNFPATPNSPETDLALLLATH
jgi:hypothetical protein